MLFGKPFNKTLTLKIWGDEKPLKCCLAKSVLQEKLAEDVCEMLFGKLGITYAVPCKVKFRYCLARIKFPPLQFPQVVWQNRYYICQTISTSALGS
jgi:alpha-D-ribose 1-methylphosphonate 5-phosphate C-P lyase